MDITATMDITDTMVDMDRMDLMGKAQDLIVRAEDGALVPEDLMNIGRDQSILV